MSKLAQMLANSKSPTTMVTNRDVFAQETGLGLGGMTSQITPIGRKDTLAQEGTGGLSSMTSTYQSTPGGTTTPKGTGSEVKTT
tara:strand:+ start:1277 stop:1528 length:252 start_codon:yes stop_codon:yes gene_type:complete